MIIIRKLSKKVSVKTSLAVEKKLFCPRITARKFHREPFPKKDERVLLFSLYFIYSIGKYKNSLNV